MNRIRYSIVIVAALLAALLLNACVHPLEHDNAELLVSIYIPDAVFTKAETGKVNPLNDEKKITSLHVWVFLHSDGSLISDKSFGAGREVLDSTGLGYSATTRFALPLDEENFKTLRSGAEVDVYVLANMPSADGITTREALENLVLEGTVFGATTPLTTSVPSEGLPMSGALRGATVTGGYPVLNISTVTLKRAVSKIHFVFTQQETPASALNPNAHPTNPYCRIMSISFDGGDDCQIAEQEYVFEKDGRDPISGYTQLAVELTGAPLVANNQIAAVEDPDEYCFRSSAHAGESAQDYETRINSLLVNHTGSQVGPIYVRETRKRISGVIKYRIDDPGNPDGSPDKTAAFSIGDDQLTRNHSWIVYAYFADETRTLQLKVAVLPWEWSQNLIDYTSGTVNVIRRFTIRETTPATFTKRPDGDGHFDVFFWHTIEVDNHQTKMDTLRGDIIIATPVGATLCVVPGPGRLAGYGQVQSNAISISPLEAPIYPNYNDNNPNNGVNEDCRIEFEIICNPYYLKRDDDDNLVVPYQYDTRFNNDLEGNYIDLYFYVRIGEEGAVGTRYIDLHSESIDYYRIYLMQQWQNPPTDI